MPTDDTAPVLHRLVVGDAAAIDEIVEASRDSEDPTTLVATALFVADPHELLARAARLATTTRDRQIVAIATAHLAGDGELVGALARDHLIEHPDSVLVAWIAAAGDRPRPVPSNDQLPKELT